tara:strand:- start:82 stop:279 length:198 start_codon:yes stop_codon:yes gene_type:complete
MHLCIFVLLDGGTILNRVAVLVELLIPITSEKGDDSGVVNIVEVTSVSQPKQFGLTVSYHLKKCY